VALNIKSFSDIVTQQVTAIQAKSTQLLDFTIGSILRAIVESNSGVILWLQQLIVNLLVITRASTSQVQIWIPGLQILGSIVSLLFPPRECDIFTIYSDKCCTYSSRIASSDNRWYAIILGCC
jgi:hypothetical protein